jgi:hypothetical protein
MRNFVGMPHTSPTDFGDCIDPPMMSEYPSRDDTRVLPRSSSWIDDLRAAAELTIIGVVGAVVGWLVDLGAFAGAGVAIALFWLAIIAACLLEYCLTNRRAKGTSA